MVSYQLAWGWFWPLVGSLAQSWLDQRLKPGRGLCIFHRPDEVHIRLKSLVEKFIYDIDANSLSLLGFGYSWP